MAPWFNKTIEWLGSHELTVLVALFVTAAGVWAFAELADEVIEGETQRLDERIVLMMRQADDPSTPVGPRWVQEMGRDFTALGGLAVLTVVTIGVAIFLLMHGSLRAMTFVLIAAVSGALLSLILKSAFSRPRPDIVPHLSHVYTSSFPSGHSMMAAVVYLTLGTLLAGFARRKRLKVYFLTVALLLTVLVGVSRVYMGVHYPTDVLAGWAAGLAWATLCWLTQKLLQRRGAVEQEGETVEADE